MKLAKSLKVLDQSEISKFDWPNKQFLALSTDHRLQKKNYIFIVFEKYDKNVDLSN